jgi:hypothetical protein
MSDKITAPGALRWMRDRFAGWLASVTVFSFLWLAVGIAVAVLFVWDGVWSRHQAPSSLDPLTFQGAGWVMRLWTVFALAGAVWCFRHKARVAGSLMALTWVATSLMTYGHALGFIATGQQERYAVASSVEKVETVAVTSGADQIAALEAQKLTVREDRDREADRLASLISEVQTNRVASDDHLAEVYAAQRDTVMAASRARLDEIDAAILTVLTTKQEARTEAASNTENVVKFDPLYILLAEWTDGKPGVPEDDYVRSMAQRVGAFWAFLLEMIGGAGPALLYSIHAHAAERRPHTVREEYSADVPPGTVRVEMTDEEWAEMQEALKIHKNIKDGAKKGARTRRLGNKIEAESDYYRQRISMFMDEHNQGYSTAEIAAKHGMTVAVMRMSYGPYMTAEESAALFPVMPAAPEPEAPEPPVAMADSPQDEPEAAPEEEAPADPEPQPEPPKEYGVALFEAPANEDENEDQPKEAAGGVV